MKFLIPYRKKGKWGFCNESKVVKIECIFDEIVIPFSNKNFELSLVKKEGKLSWINIKGDKISPDADIIHPFTSIGISTIILDEKNANSLRSKNNCLFIDKFGRHVFEIDAITCNGFQNGVCIVLFPNKKYGAIDSSGKIIFEAKYEEYTEIWKEIGSPIDYDNNSSQTLESDKSLNLFVENSLFGFRDKKNRIVIKPKYIMATPFYNGFSIVSNEKGAVFHIDRSGERIYPQSYYYVKEYENGIAKVVTDKLSIDPFIHSRWGVDYYIPENANWGYIDLLGNEYWEN